MSNLPHTDPLDRLLAQPAQIVDDGFVARLQLQIRRAESRRQRLFLGAIGVWLLATMLAWSPGAFLQWAQRTLNQINFDQSVSVLNGIAGQVAAASFEASAMAASLLLLALLAVASLLVKT